MEDAKMLDIIEKTRDGQSLTESDVSRLIQGIVDNTWPDYQLAAWLMAVVLKGLTREETFWLTGAMAGLAEHTQPLGLVDKHSTGGVGDKTTIVLAPLMAALDLPMAKMSGRGLGHTGGTLDKLESIPGFKTDLTVDQMRQQVAQVGVAVVAQSQELAPADRRLYALRDVTGTVNNLSLIASSIMSKKLAAGTPNLVLDVKVGSGAFMHTQEQAQQLARLMVEIGSYYGRHVTAVITSMQQPLGWAVGNAIEVNEAVQTLSGSGPDDLRHEVIHLAAELLCLTRPISHPEAVDEAAKALNDGRALQKFAQWISCQGGDTAILSDPLKLAPVRRDWLAPNEVDVQSMDARIIGRAALNLGAGRHRLEDTIDPAVGLHCYAKVGRHFHRSEAIATIYARTQSAAEIAHRDLTAAIRFGHQGEPQPLILERVTQDS